jgi:hypothetical protein
VPEDVRKNLSDMTLRIETVRTHGMLHTLLSFEGRTASIFLNDRLLEEINILKVPFLVIFIFLNVLYLLYSFVFYKYIFLF